VRKYKRISSFFSHSLSLQIFPSYNKYDRNFVLLIFKKRRKNGKEKSRPLEDGLLFPKQKEGA
jgi:hypothetical protein